MEKKIYKRPVEVFGHDSEIITEPLKLALNQQYCKYLKGTCNKPRKSEPLIKVGICSLGATVAKEVDVHPVIICPYRFREESMFETIRLKYLSSWKNVKWIPEVSIGVGGNVDFVAVELDNKGDIKDFLCVEIQAGGTTGSPYPAIQQLKEYGRYTNDDYTYGINWANEFSKTMMQQAYKKGKIIQHWNRKIVFVIQDVAMKYLESASDCSLLSDFDPTKPIDFCMFRLDWESDNEWHLIFDSIKSSTVEGIDRILGGAAAEDYPSEEEFVTNIIRKGVADGILKLKL